jgi:hypothetical protein
LLWHPDPEIRSRTTQACLSIGVSAPGADRNG